MSRSPARTCLVAALLAIACGTTDKIRTGGPSISDTSATGDTGCVDDEATSWFPDTDGDGYGSADGAVSACEPPEGFVADDTDCDDTEADVWPGASEACDGKDNDCDGAVDEGEDWFWYRDDDDDGFGVEGTGTASCHEPDGTWVHVAGDCDDGDARVNPDAGERCGNGVDDDCNGLVDGDEDWCMTYFDEAMGILEGDEDNPYVGYDIAPLGDIDGDGYDDLMINGYYTSIVYGPVTGTHALADARDAYFSGAWTVGRRASFDVDGDGEVELLLRSANDDGETLYVLPADTTGSTHPATVADFQIQDSPARGTFGSYVDAAGDINGDGFGDLMVSASAWYDDDEGDWIGGAVFFVYGPTTADRAVTEETDVIYEADVAWQQLGHTLTGMGDVDGDGYDDAAVTSPCDGAYTLCGDYAPAIWLLRGPVTQAAHLDDIAVARIAIEAEEIAALGDVTGDGVPDLGLAETDDGSHGRPQELWIVSGDLAGTHDDATTFATASIYDDRPWGEYFRAGSIAALDDLDGNGVRDLVVSDAPSGHSESLVSTTLLFAGPVIGDTPASSARAECGWDSSRVWPTYRYISLDVGDINGDGTHDIIAGAPYEDANGVDSAGAAYIVSGASLVE